MKEKFIELLKSTNREGMDNLIEFLEKSDFFKAPASTRFHGDHEGGLAEHSFKVYEILKEKIKKTSEEMGFIVAVSVIILYVILVTKCIYVAKTAKDDIGSLISSGIAGIFLFHMVENIGMVMGLLPITGVPLPFISYGGSSLITNFICIGILLNISSKRQKIIFVK